MVVLNASPETNTQQQSGFQSPIEVNPAILFARPAWCIV